MAISRSENMRRIRGKNTKPEIVVRHILRSLGYAGYRLHRRDLPGTPDIAYIGRKKAIIINGCFWHGHECKKGNRRPKSNIDYWVNKIKKNKERDIFSQKALRDLGWAILVIWECDLKDRELLCERIKKFLN